jgi:hypothetical protein
MIPNTIITDGSDNVDITNVNVGAVVCNNSDFSISGWLPNSSKNGWVNLTVERLIPSKEELDNHPSLKAAWEEYLVIKRLIGKT